MNFVGKREKVKQIIYCWKLYFPMQPYVCLLVGLSVTCMVGWSVVGLSEINFYDRFSNQQSVQSNQKYAYTLMCIKYVNLEIRFDEKTSHFLIYFLWKWNFAMNPHVHLLVGLSFCRLVCLNFLERQDNHSIVAPVGELCNHNFYFAISFLFLKSKLSEF